MTFATSPPSSRAPVHGSNLARSLSPPVLNVVRCSEHAPLEGALTTTAMTASDGSGAGERRQSSEQLEKGDMNLSSSVLLQGEEDFSYPEGGARAWLVVLGCWLFAASQLSIGMSWGGVVQDLNVRFPEEGLARLNLLGGLTNFFTNAVAFLSGRMADKYGYRPVLAAGAVSTVASLVLSGVCQNSLPGLFVVQGVLLGSSIGLGFPLFMSLPSHWFLRRRGLATGIAVSGTGFGGAFISWLVRLLFPRYGYRTTMLIWAAIVAVTSLFALLFAQPRLPVPKAGDRSSRDWLPRGMWSDGAFYSTALAVCIGIFGYLVPLSFLNIYTQEKVPRVGNGTGSAVPLIVGNISSGCGRIIAGLIADRVGPVNMLIASFLVGGLLELAVFPRTESYGEIIGFASAYGLTASWMVSLLPPALSQLFGVEGLATMSGFMVLCSAPGQFVGPTLGGLVLSASNHSWAAMSYYGGGTMILGSIILCYARFSRESRLLIKF